MNKPIPFPAPRPEWSAVMEYRAARSIGIDSLAIDRPFTVAFLAPTFDQRVADMAALTPTR